MDNQKFRVGQKVRVEDVHEGVVTRVLQDGIYVDGLGRLFRPAPGMTRTITILSEPKPDEPKLLGAVVRDAHGNTWSRSGVFQSAPWRKLGGSTYVAWSGIDAVEVLFPGVES